MTKETDVNQIQTDSELLGNRKNFDYNELIRQVAEYCRIQDALRSETGRQEARMINDQNFFGVIFEE